MEGYLETVSAERFQNPTHTPGSLQCHHLVISSICMPHRPPSIPSACPSLRQPPYSSLPPSFCHSLSLWHVCLAAPPGCAAVMTGTDAPTPSRDRDSDRDLTETERGREGGRESDGGRFTSSIPVATSLQPHVRGRDSASHIDLHTAYHLSRYTVST